jgi:hypothetical protein
MRQTLIFWQTGPGVELSADAIAQELSFGEDVAGLVDLPIKEIIGRIKAEFPESEERTGLLVGRGIAGPFEVNWSWQFFRVEAAHLDDADRKTFGSIGREFGCEPYELKNSPFPLG